MWTAMPGLERIKLGWDTQKQFCDAHHIVEKTPSNWKKRPEFWKRVESLRAEWAKDKSGDVIYGIYRAAVKGNPLSQKLWLQYFHNFAEKTEHTESKVVEVSVNDIRFVIDQLPEPLRTKHYDNLTELLDDASAFERARGSEDGSRFERPADEVRDEADNDAQDVSYTEADEVAEGDSKRIRQDLEWKTQPRHHESTAWWRQEQTFRDDRF